MEPIDPGLDDKAEAAAATPVAAGTPPTTATMLLALIIVAGLVVLLVLGFSLYWTRDLSIAGFVGTIRDLGMWGVAGSIFLMIGHSFVPFPAELLACANGMVYGPVWGTVITWTGAMLGAVLAFGLARRFGRPLVEHLVSRRDWQAIDVWTAKNGWQMILIGRFIPVIAFNLINYAAGLTRLTWWQFLVTTGLGILPMTVLMVVMGDNFEHLGWQVWLALMVAGLILWLAVRRIFKNRL